MDNRISGKFVVGYNRLQEIVTENELEAIVRGSLGSNLSTGTVLEITVTVKTSSEPKWIACSQLGSYGKCERLNPPSTKCTNEHYHTPNWLESSDEVFTTWTCVKCAELGITPSKNHDAPEYYNHSNVQQ